MPLSRRSAITFAAGLAFHQPSRAAAARGKIIVAGGHPGDPECGCGGTIARYTQMGYEAVLLYMNRGEGYCSRPDLTQCAAVRTAEAQAACAILRARPAFAGQIDAKAVLDNSHYADFARLLEAEKPDLLFVHWPLDRHRDHRALSLLALDAWLQSGKKAALYFYEVADDTMMFTPNDFVDISSVEDKRRGACYAHLSQQPDRWYPRQTDITRFRGKESGYAQAEAFLRHAESKRGMLP